MKPLTIYLSDEPASLGTGGISISAPEIYRPATLMDSGKYISFLYRNEDVLHLKEGDWRGTSVGTTTRGVFGVMPLPLPRLKKNAIAFLSKDFESRADIVGNEQGVSFGSLQGYNGTVVSFSTSPIPLIKAGIGWENYSAQSGLSDAAPSDATFYELAFTPDDSVRFNYRRFRREMNIRVLLNKDDYLGKFFFQPAENVKEVSFYLNVPEALQLNIAIEDTQSNNMEAFVKVFCSDVLSLSYRQRSRELDFYNELFIDETPRGHIHGAINYSDNDIAINLSPTATRYTLGIRKSGLEIDGAGKVIDDSLLNFWQTLLAGERFFNYNLDLQSTQYYLGIENKTTQNLTLRGGLQYIVTRPDGYLDHWTPFPLFKIGKLDEQVLDIGYTKATLGAITMGLNYRMNNIEFRYGLGQVIPIKVDQKGEADITPPTEKTGGERRVWDRETENSGGNTQTLEIIFYF